MSYLPGSRPVRILKLSSNIKNIAECCESWAHKLYASLGQRISDTGTASQLRLAVALHIAGLGQNEVDDFMRHWEDVKIEWEETPSVALLATNWLHALADAKGPTDRDGVLNAGRLLVQAAGLEDGALLAVAMKKISARAGNSAPASSEPVTIQWVELDKDEVYVLDQHSGPHLTVLEGDLRHTDVYLDRGAAAPNRVLLLGPPGCGKTKAVEWLARELGLKLAVIRLSETVSKWVGETGRLFAKSVAEARDAGAILLIDEIDTIGGNREQNASSSGVAQVVGAINQTLDAMPKSMIIIGATNLPDAVDPAISRRLPTVIKFTYPDPNAREAMGRALWARAPFFDGALVALVARTDGRSGDAVAHAAHAANRRAARRGAAELITEEDVVVAMSTITRERQFGNEPGKIVVVR